MSRRLLIGFILLLLVSGCAEKKIVQRRATIPAERVMIKVEAKRRRVNTFKGSGTIKIRTKTSENKFNFVLKFKKPDSLYVAGYGPFGITLSEFILTDNSFEYYDDVNNIVYRGGSPGRIIKKIFNFNLSQNEFRNLLLGFADFNLDLRHSPKKYFYDDKYFHLTFEDSLKNIRRYLIDKKEIALKEFGFKSAGKQPIDLKVKYANFKDFEDGKLIIPLKIKAVVNNPSTVLNVNYRKIEINKKITSLKFNIPNDAEVVEW